MVHAKKIGGVVALFDRAQTIPRRTRVGIADSRVAFRTQKVYVSRAIAALQRAGEAANPGVVRGGLVGAQIDGAHGDKGPAPADGRRPWHRPGRGPSRRRERGPVPPPSRPSKTRGD